MMVITFLINFWNFYRVGGFEQTDYAVVNAIMIITLFVDILVTCNRSLIKRGTRISDHKEIFFNYLRGFCFFDLV